MKELPKQKILCAIYTWKFVSLEILSRCFTCIMKGEEGELRRFLSIYPLQLFCFEMNTQVLSLGLIIIILAGGNN